MSLRDHQRVANGDHSDHDIDMEPGKEALADSEAFNAKKLEARELARAVTIRPGEVKIGNRGI
jgi:hypothetical protein